MSFKKFFAAAAVLASVGRLASGQVAVGPTVHVSTALSSTTHDEVSLGTDPADPQRLVACSMIDTPLAYGQHKNAAVVYVSVDGGRNWMLGPRATFGAGDPSCGYGPDGTVYFASVSPDDKWDTLGSWTLEFFRSNDSGHTWGPVLRSKGGDRPWLAIDGAHGGTSGALYVVDQERLHGLQSDSLHGLIGLYLRRSVDGGLTWSAPAIRLQMGGSVKPGSAATPGRAVVLRDGTVVILYLGFERSPATVPARAGTDSRELAYYVTSSGDSGRTLTTGLKLARIVQFHGIAGTGGGLGTLAADVGGRSPFPDRLYAAWSDARSGRAEIYFSYSTDKGRTWTSPRVVSDDSAWTSPKVGPDNELPTLAVNRDGVVGLLWYDRRDNLDNLGFYPRFRASLDGGDTWLPSVRLTDRPNQFTQPDGTQLATEVTRQIDAGEPADSEAGLAPRAVNSGPTTMRVVNEEWITNGHTAGLEADARGVFHPLWVDNRTGVKQVYTAPVTVHGAVTRNGEPSLAGLVDLTAAVMVDLSPAGYDAVTHVVTLRARLRNTSHDTLRGPFVMRAVHVTSELGTPQAVNAENGQTRAGARWRFTGSTDGALPPGATTAEQVLEFRVTPPRRREGPVDFKWGLVTIDARVLGAYAGSH